LGLELIPVFRQSTCRWHCYIPSGRLPLLSTRPAVIFQAREHHCHLALPNYTAWWLRHMCVNNFPRVVTW